MVFHLNDTVFLGAWAVVGSTLSFLAFRNSHDKPPSERLKQCILSVCLGLFLAFPLYEYLNYSDRFLFTKNLNMMLSGIGAFGLPDIILRHWPNIVNRVIDKVFGGRERDNDNHYHNDKDFGE